MALAALVVALAVSPAAADPYTCTGGTCTSLATYTEPTTCVGGALFGTGICPALQQTEIQWNLNGGANTTIVVPASKATGGGAIANTLTGASVAACTKATQNVSVIARTTNGLAGLPATTSLLLDRTVLQGTTTPDPTCVTPGPINNLQVN